MGDRNTQRQSIHLLSALPTCLQGRICRLYAVTYANDRREYVRSVKRCSPKLTVVSCLMPLTFQLTLRPAARLFLVLYDSLDTYSRAFMIWEFHSVLLCGCQMVATFSGHNTRRPGSKLVASADVRDFRNWKVFILSCTSRSVWFV